MNLKNFKKVSSDKDSTTLQHPDGHQIKIAHKSLSAKVKKSLSDLPVHYAEGTPDEPVGEEDDSDREPASSRDSAMKRLSMTPSEQAFINGGMQNYAVPPEQQSFGNEPAPVIPEEKPQISISNKDDGVGYGGESTIHPSGVGSIPTPESIQSQLTPKQGEMPAQSVLRNVGQGANLEAQAIQSQAANTKQFSNVAAAQNFNTAENLGKVLAQSKSDLDDFRSTSTDILKQFADAKVKIPQEMLWGDKNTGQKILTGLGLLINGMGGPQNNKLLMDQLKMAQDAQKANLGKFPTLLEANIRKYGSTQLGMQAYKMQQLDMASTMLQGFANQYQGTTAGNNALQGIGQLLQNKSMQEAPFLQQLFIQKFLNDPSFKQGKPESQIDALGQYGVIPPERAKEMKENLTNYRSVMTSRDNALRIFDQMNAMAGKGTLSPNEYTAMRDQAFTTMMPYLSTSGGGRWSPERSETEATAFFPQKLSMLNTGDWKSTIAQKRQALIQEYNAHPNMQKGETLNNSFPPINMNNENFQYDKYGNSKLQMNPPVIPKKQVSHAPKVK